MSSTLSNNFALVDCNNFFASCEQIFNPKLQGKPLVILSSNDGCIISRSKEAKALGIKMGAPAFHYKKLFFEKDVISLSSNFALYADMSARVMNTLESFGFPVAVYSIDEAFLTLPPLSLEALEDLGHSLRRAVKKWTGIPIAVGVAPTKTLAKAANESAKKSGGVLIANSEDRCRELLKNFSIEDVWGIGPKMADLLRGKGVHTACELMQKTDVWIRRYLTVAGLRTAWELRGKSVFEEGEEPLARSMTSSRSFGKEVKDFETLKEAISSFAASVAKRLRSAQLLATELSIFISTAPFKESGYYAKSACVKLPAPSSYTPLFTSYATSLLKEIFKEGFIYKKAGVVVANLVLESELQLDLWVKPKKKEEYFLQVMDEVNTKLGKKALRFAAEGTSYSWQSKSCNRSPCFTTSWNDLPVVTRCSSFFGPQENF